MNDKDRIRQLEHMLQEVRLFMCGVGSQEAEMAMFNRIDEVLHPPVVCTCKGTTNMEDNPELLDCPVCNPDVS